MLKKPELLKTAGKCDSVPVVRVWLAFLLEQKPPTKCEDLMDIFLFFVLSFITGFLH